jgi:HAD superfamily phosphoserine phosphatase-like hydrolase
MKFMEVKKELEVREVQEVLEKRGEIAAFFDLDGTLVALPSLERKFIQMLRSARAIPARNYFLWLREAVRLLPCGITAVLQANKMYLRGVQSFDERGGRDDAFFPWHQSRDPAEGQAPAPSSRRALHHPGLPVPGFFAEAIERVEWHAKQGHVIVIVSGTLEPLASAAALSLLLRLAVNGITSLIGVRATKLEEAKGRCTGRVVGEPMFGEAKARAVERIASEMKMDLTKCYAYGDSVNDRWLLEAVGWPAAVNPSKELGRIARCRRWPVLHWEREKKVIAQTRDDRVGESAERRGIPKTASANCSVRGNAGAIPERTG